MQNNHAWGFFCIFAAELPNKDYYEKSVILPHGNDECADNDRTECL